MPERAGDSLFLVKILLLLGIYRLTFNKNRRSPDKYFMVDHVVEKGNTRQLGRLTRRGM
jgi:hypothetical protein